MWLCGRQWLSGVRWGRRSVIKKRRTVWAGQALVHPMLLVCPQRYGCGDGLGPAECLLKAGWEVVVLGDATWCILSALYPWGGVGMA